MSNTNAADRYWVDAQPYRSLDPGLRALHYGDGLFETLRVEGHSIAYLDRHLQRLRAGCERLQLDFDDWHGLEAELLACAAGQPGTAVIKIILSRAAGTRGYRYGKEQGVTRIVGVHPSVALPSAYSRDGVRVRLCQLRLASQPRLAGIKHLNRLEQVLARAEWGDEYEEGLLLDYNERLVEGTMSNLFLVRDGCLSTPRLDHCGVAGVMRAVLLELAAELGLETQVQRLNTDDLEGADEVFLCNSLIGVWPVNAVADQFSYPVGSVTRKLQRALAAQDTSRPGNWVSE